MLLQFASKPSQFAAYVTPIKTTFVAASLPPFVSAISTTESATKYSAHLATFAETFESTYQESYISAVSTTVITTIHATIE